MPTPFTESLDVQRLIHQGHRDEQQDAFRDEVLADHALFVLADGMGGHSGGAIASRAVTSAITENLATTLENETPALDLKVSRRRGPKTDGHWHLFHLFEQGAEALEKARSENPELDPRTTCVAALFEGNEIHVANAGDSRCFIIRANGEIWHTDDHSIARMLVVTGEITEEEAQHHPDRNKLYRSLTEGGEDADYYTHPALLAGDALILCSDGFWEHLRDEELRQIAAEEDLSGLFKEHTKRILERAGPRADNLSALVVRSRMPDVGAAHSQSDERTPQDSSESVQGIPAGDDAEAQTRKQPPAAAVEPHTDPQHSKRKTLFIAGGILALIAAAAFLALRPSAPVQSNTADHFIEPVELAPPSGVAPNETAPTPEQEYPDRITE